MHILNAWQDTLRTAMDIVYPRRCPGCDEIVAEPGEKICFQCLKSMKLLTPPWCMKCGKKVAEGEEYCADCSRQTHAFVRGRAIYDYSGVAEAIYRFKYGHRREYADYWGEEIARFLGDFILGTHADALVPVPLHRKRQLTRGYNQAELLAKAIGRELGVCVNTHLISRNRQTVPMKQLNPEERQNNLKKAFNVVQNDVKLKTIILVDDIYTTGTTMDEVTRTLMGAGVEKVYFITLACGMGV